MSKEVMAKHQVAKALVEACKGQTDKRLTVDDCKKILELLPEVIVGLVATDMVVRIPGLISFEPKVVEERIARNPKTGEEITVAPTRLVKITKSRAFADKVKATYTEVE